MLKKTDIKIAVLDNGVDEKMLALCGLSDTIQQNEGNISDDGDLFLHGTNCAIIIGLNCANAELYSYKLLDNTGKGNVNNLKSAFDWCLMNNIRLVNLSFGTTHFKDKSIIRQLVNQYVNKGLIIVAATANSGYTAFPASVSSIIGVKASDTFRIDESLQDRGVDFSAPSEHTFRLAGNNIKLPKSNSYATPYVTALVGQLMVKQPEIKVWQVKQQLYQRLGEKCVQYVPDWIEKGWIAGKVLNSKAEVYFEVTAKEEADTVILYDKNEFNEYREKHIVYLGNEIAEEPDTQCFFWSGRNREKQILCSRIKKENINIPVILLKSDKEQDQIWWLTELRKCFEAEGYNAYTISSEKKGVLYDLEYIPFAVDENISNKICDFLYWQTYYNQSDLIICGIQENEKESIGVEADIFVRIENRKQQTEIQIYCERPKKAQMCFETLGEQQIKEVYECLLRIFMEDEDE
ncbi:MAG: S8 family serine peptidase [Acetivibrio ethanolgignens]